MLDFSVNGSVFNLPIYYSCVVMHTSHGRYKSVFVFFFKSRCKSGVMYILGFSKVHRRLRHFHEFAQTRSLSGRLGRVKGRPRRFHLIACTHPTESGVSCLRSIGLASVGSGCRMDASRRLGGQRHEVSVSAARDVECQEQTIQIVFLGKIVEHRQIEGKVGWPGSCCWLGW